MSLTLSSSKRAIGFLSKRAAHLSPFVNESVAVRVRDGDLRGVRVVELEDLLVAEVLRLLRVEVRRVALGRPDLRPACRPAITSCPAAPLLPNDLVDLLVAALPARRRGRACAASSCLSLRTSSSSFRLTCESTFRSFRLATRSLTVCWLRRRLHAASSAATSSAAPPSAGGALRVGHLLEDDLALVAVRDADLVDVVGRADGREVLRGGRRLRRAPRPSCSAGRRGRRGGRGRRHRR